jgi:hypothetical protein
MQPMQPCSIRDKNGGNDVCRHNTLAKELHANVLVHTKRAPLNSHRNKATHGSGTHTNTNTRPAPAPALALLHPGLASMHPNDRFRWLLHPLGLIKHCVCACIHALRGRTVHLLQSTFYYKYNTVIVVHGVHRSEQFWSFIALLTFATPTKFSVA